MTLELESKFLPAQIDRPKRLRKDVRRALKRAGFAVAGCVRTRHIDTYLDTPAHDLLQAGWSLRLRDAPMAAQLTLKSLSDGRDGAGEFRRQEINQPLQSQHVTGPLPAQGAVITQLAALGIQPDRLRPLFCQEVSRRSRTIERTGSAIESLEWAEDKVRVAGTTYREYEFELLTGDGTGLQNIAQLLTRLRCSPAWQSKFQRGLQFSQPAMPLPAGPAVHRLTPQSPWQAFAWQCLTAQLDALQRLAPGAYEALHNEGVHQMRVQCRRLRASLSMFQPVLPAALYDQLLADVRALTRCLGAVRDLDVMLELLGGHQGARGNAYSLLDRQETKFWLAQRQDALQQLRAAMDQLLPRLSARRQRLVELGPVMVPRGSAAEADWVVAEGVEQCLQTLLLNTHRRGNRITRDSADRKYHKLRIQLKQLRYQLDNVDRYTQCEPHRIGTLIEATRKLQNLLGRHQDACMLLQMIDTRVAQQSGRDGHRVGKIRRRQRKIMRRCRRRFAFVWAAFAREAV